MTRVLVLGSGAAEHALAARLLAAAESPEVIVAPGNAGLAEEIDVRALAAPNHAVALAAELAPDFVVVNDLALLRAGVAAALRADAHFVFGPGATGGDLEGSADALARLVTGARLPVTDDAATHEFPVFLDGKGFRAAPAIARGADVATTLDEVPLARWDRVVERLVLPTLSWFHREAIDYRGLLSFAVSFAGDEPRLAGVRARFDDLAAAVLVAAIDDDLLALLRSCAEGRLARGGFVAASQPAAAVVATDDRPLHEHAYALRGPVTVISAIGETPTDALVNARGPGR